MMNIGSFKDNNAVSYFVKAKKEMLNNIFNRNLKAGSGQYSYEYLDLGHLLNIADPILSKYDLAISQKFKENTIYTYIIHSSGDYFYMENEIYLIEKILATANVKNVAQSVGAMQTYFRRYALCATLGIFADKDSDAIELTTENKSNIKQSQNTSSNKRDENSNIDNEIPTYFKTNLKDAYIFTSLVKNFQDEIFKDIANENNINISGIKFFASESQMNTMINVFKRGTNDDKSLGFLNSLEKSIYYFDKNYKNKTMLSRIKLKYYNLIKKTDFFKEEEISKLKDILKEIGYSFSKLDDKYIAIGLQYYSNGEPVSYSNQDTDIPF